MPAATETPDGPRPVLGSAGNRVRVTEEQRPKKEPAAAKATKVIPPSPEKPSAVAAVQCNCSAETSFESSSSSSSGSIVKSCKSIASQRAKNSNGVVKSEKSVRDEALIASPAVPIPVKRCDWITPNSEPLYTCFHDEEWGVPIHDDTKLFELLVLSVALAELSWPEILTKRPIFRKIFDDFVPKSVANLDIDRMLSTRMNGSSLLLSEPKLRAVVENARQVLKIQQDLGSFANYCWRFVNNKSIKSGFRYTRQVPAKTPKSELMSKDMMQRGFRCVGPTVIYSFMQASGIVNDHLVSCFRYNECSQTTPSGHKST